MPLTFRSVAKKLGKAGKKALQKGIAGNPILKALPGGALVSTAVGLAMAPRGGKRSTPATFTGGRPGLDFGDVGDFIRRVAPGGATGRGRVAPDSQTGRCPQGYHPAKDGRGCVRNRRTNVANPRALARALRRAEGFEKLARRTVTALHRGPSKFKKRAKKR